MTVSLQPGSILEAYLGDPRSLDRVSTLERLRLADAHLALHADAVAELVRAMTDRLCTLTCTERALIIDAAWLHDIGKLTIAPETLNKPGPLTDAEWIEMRDHPGRGADFLNLSPGLRQLAPFVRHHHERNDGTGYPDGLAGSDIPLGARLIGVADAYDAMISWRPYRAPRSETDARAELRRCSGSQFDPDVVALFLDVVSLPRSQRRT
ncbi:MAG: HD domain-containing phosphohydrolase [Thermomicrobiales bacterium]